VDGERLHAEKINRKGTQRTQRFYTRENSTYLQA
jgi:hypothetical protein